MSAPTGPGGDGLVLLPSDILTGLPVTPPVAHATWDLGAPLPPASVLERVALVVPPYNASTADLAVLARMPRLAVVQTLTAGVDHVLPVLPALPTGVTLCNAAGVHDASTAELAVGLVLASLRHLDDFARAMPEGRWAYDRFDALADKRVLIVGFGSIGRAIARRLDGFACEVLAVARSARTIEGVPVHASAELDGLLPTADVVILILPLTEQTRGMVDARFLGRMHDGALLVNVARGPIVDTAALMAELAARRLRAALDVTDPEPLPEEHPLWRLPGVLISPHVGGNTSAFLPRARRLVAEQLRRWAAAEPLDNVVVTR
jgi:phosphoglycerate dehydrogenase-like enzyme